MAVSYAVKWREPGGRTFLGKLELGETELVLEGRDRDACAIRRTIDLVEPHGFRLSRTAAERLDGQGTLVIERAGGDVLVTSTLVHAGVVQELVHRLAATRLPAAT